MLAGHEPDIGAAAGISNGQTPPAPWGKPRAPTPSRCRVCPPADSMRLAIISSCDRISAVRWPQKNSRLLMCIRPAKNPKLRGEGSLGLQTVAGQGAGVSRQSCLHNPAARGEFLLVINLVALGASRTPGALLARVFQIGGSNGEFLASVRAPIARRIANEELGQKTDSKHCEDADQKISPHYVSPFTATIAGAESLPPRRTEASQGKREEFLSRVRETTKRARSVFMCGLIF